MCKGEAMGNPISVLYLGSRELMGEIAALVGSYRGGVLHIAATGLEADAVLRTREVTTAVVNLGGSHDAGWIEELRNLAKRQQSIQWLALIASEYLERTSVARLIVDVFHDYLLLPIDVPALAATILRGHRMSELRGKVSAKRGEHIDVDGMVGSSPAMRDLVAAVGKVAASTASVLITGESGTGKELVARAVHRNSRFSKGPFVAINCAAIPVALIESELFGHEQGAFTGAYRRKMGLIETAIGGTVFLDEISELNFSAQATLLRFLQERVIRRVGGGLSIPVETRVIAATNANIHEAVKAGRFREDLFFRLAVLRIKIPPLRERDGDAECLADYYLRIFAREEGRSGVNLSEEAVSAIATYSWPGNVRELINRVRRAVVMTSDGEIRASDLGLTVENIVPFAPGLDGIRGSAEAAGIRWALTQSDYNWSKAATLLRVSRSTLYRLADRRGVSLGRLHGQSVENYARDHAVET